MTKSQQRIYAIDWLRGMAMVWMAVAHSGIAFITGYHFFESPFRWEPGTPIPSLYFTRAITHICAPTFLFLSGVSLYLSVQNKILARIADWQIDRELIVRGMILLLIEVFLFNWLLGSTHGILLQVLFAIGASLMFMVLIRRIPIIWLTLSIFVFLLFGESIVYRLIEWNGGKRDGLLAYILYGGYIRTQTSAIIISYPVLPWLAMMSLGWCFGNYLRANPLSKSTNLLVASGIMGAFFFLVIRFLNGYGNMGLLRDEGIPLSWFYMSKYPPSLAFYSLELGIMCLVFAGLLSIGDHSPRLIYQLKPLAILGQASLFFYIGHSAVIAFVKNLFPNREYSEWWIMYAGGIFITLFFIPLSMIYLRAKKRYGNTLLRYF